MIDYGFIKLLDLPFEEVIDRITGELKGQGFGILTKIDVREKFREKLGIDYKKYVILGACNPPFAHRALEEEENIGLMLPCNVAVYEKEGKTALAIIKLATAMQMIANEHLRNIAVEIEGKLKSAFDAV